MNYIRIKIWDALFSRPYPNIMDDLVEPAMKLGYGWIKQLHAI